MSMKFLLTAAVAMTIGAVMSNTAFANVSDMSSTFCKSGFYVGVQGGRSDTFYHPDKVLDIAALNGAGNETSTLIISSVFPENRTEFDTTSTTLLSKQKADDIGIGGRIYAGYQFNPYFALETGYTQYANTSFQAEGTTTKVQTISVDAGFGPNPGNTTNTTSVTDYSGKVTEHAIDMVAKATLPLRHGLGLYAKAGAAYIEADRHINAQAGLTTVTVINNDDPSAPYVESRTTTNNSTHNTIYGISYHAFRPVAGAGINYTIPRTAISIDASYTRVFSSGAIPNASLLALGLEYKFA